MPTRSLHLSDWPTNERPREKLLESGPSSLTDAELIALLFGTGIRGTNALDLARSLLREHGSLRNLLTASTDRALNSRGLGPARVASLRAALELALRSPRPPTPPDSSAPNCGTVPTRCSAVCISTLATVSSPLKRCFGAP